MVAQMWSLMRFLIKGSVAGGAVYLAYDHELLGPSDKSEAALRRAEEVVPPAMYQFSQYVCEQAGLQLPQVMEWESDGQSAQWWPCVPSALLTLPDSPVLVLLFLPSSQTLQRLTCPSESPGIQASSR
ncbi:MICOS complex subunit MIC13 isoform X1 [Perognathus longimembris pacificus]|uniref:MICOS complex subunit MIC13 isoform X1 n=1 Tax=Perognathus longimembris pacificus TaxID=214514 RepID=UPI002018B458|nr:MICOS complex subunit MIC13 isoform X1 [Perognathus longimembris pacificus]